MLPDVTLKIQDGGLGIVPGNASRTCAKLGISAGGTANTLYAFGDKNTAIGTLVAGPLLEAVCDTLDIAGGPVLAMPLNPSGAGSIGSTVHGGGGGGAGTISGAAAPASTIAAKVVTGGVLGVMTVAFSVNGGAYGSPILSTVTSFSVVVPGTLTTLTFSSQTYTSAAVWTFNTDGTSSLSGTGTLGWVTAVSSTLDNFDFIATIAQPGAAGTATFKWSLDGNNNVSGETLVPSGGVFVVPGSGLVLTFASTFAATDTYEIKTGTATYSNSDVTAACTVLLADQSPWGLLQVVGAGSNAAAAASLAAVVDAQLASGFTNFRYARGIVSCPTSESDSTVASAFANFVSDRVMVCAGDILHLSAISGRLIRRNLATVVATRLSDIAPSIDAGNDDPGDELTAMPRVSAIYRDEFKTPALDAQRFCTLRTEVGDPGFFVTNPNMMAAPGSDYGLMQMGRVMDVACATTRQAMLPFLNSRITVDASTGYIAPIWASRIEKRVQKILSAVLVAAGDADAVTAVVTRNVNILSTKTIPITIGVVPHGYAKFINVTIGFVNPALA